MSYKITLIPGDGVGPEVTREALRAIEATGVDIMWERTVVGDAAQDQSGTPLPDYVIESVKKNKIALKGPVTTPMGTGFRSVNVALRQKLDLYACVRPCKSYQGVSSPFRDVDIVVVRENTEDLYCGIEFEKGSPGTQKLIDLIKEDSGRLVGKDSGFSLKMISETGARRIVKFAFEYAREHGRKKVTAVHKANILKFSDGLFLNAAREVAREYGDIEFEDVVVDTLCMRLVRVPQQFDVIVLPNLYGDFISELCAGLVGGLGLAPGANVGNDIAVFEPTHGSAPKYTGQNKVNPMAMMLSGAMMVRYLGEIEAADMMESAIAAVIREGKSLTYDMNREGIPAVGTTQVGNAVIEKLEGLKKGATQ
ncbi:MAG: isocitrate/isopropylmalate dehydrogenase family protein [Dehalococcoidia bacterium]|nr:isocitrate/isopropylmalate dehydrogenase family protein [Dehalococcoidia bacterium]